MRFLVFVPLLCMATLALAEPPVGDGYPAAQSHHHDHGFDHDDHTSDHQSPSQEYGVPSLTSRNAPFDGYDYNSPNGRGQSKFPPATVRVSFNQRFSSVTGRNLNPSARNQQSAPNAHVSQEYGPTASRSLSQEYGAPSVSTRTVSTEYGVPNSRSVPSGEYGAPIAARNNKKSVFGARSSSLKNNARSYTEAQSRSFSSGKSNQISDYSPKSVFSSRNAPSSTYSAPSHSNKPSSRSFNAQSDLVSQVYGAPNQDLSDTYGVPNTRSLSQEYGVPSSRSNSRTEAVALGYSSARSSPSSAYLPAARDAPSQQYGVPAGREAPSQQYGAPGQESQGYENAQARALNELLNQEPASYDFGYQIEDQESGSDFGHSETREENKAEGSYFVVLPDGTKQTVEYEADEGGFKPRISVEPADAAARSGGYDDNAQDLARSAGGPY